MTAIAMPLADDVIAARDGLLAFARKEVLPRHAKHRALFDNPRELYREDGRFSDALLGLIRGSPDDVRRRRLLQMCVPEALGGGGLGHLAYYVAWEALFHLCGPKNWLMLYAIAHWAFGPSRLLTQCRRRGARRMLARLMDGTRSMCFGLVGTERRL